MFNYFSANGKWLGAMVGSEGDRIRLKILPLTVPNMQNSACQPLPIVVDYFYSPQSEKISNLFALFRGKLIIN